MKIVYAKQGDTLDALIYRYLGQKQGLLEKTLMLNPQLAQMAELNIGQKVILPNIENEKNIKETVHLWT